MRLTVVYQLAKVLVTSQLRSTRQVSRPRRLIGRPVILAIADIIVFAVATFTVYELVGALARSRDQTIQNALLSAAVGGLTSVPLFVLSGIVTLGILYEVSVSAQFASADIVNFLPLSSGEYVLASTLSIAYVYSPFWILSIGAVLPLANQYRLLNAWGLMVILSLLALLTGGIIVEMIRAAVNRVSSAFYRRGGKSIILGRLVITVSVIAFFQLLVNPNFLLPVIGALTQGATEGWFVPFAWYLEGVLNLINGEITRAFLFGAGSAIFTATLFVMAVQLRSRYWVPSIVTVRVTNSIYAPRRGIIGKLGFNQIESAIIRKDFKSLLRRREMARFLAIPVAILIPIMLPFFSPTSTRSLNLGQFLIFPLYLGLVLSALLLSMTSIGQEGKAVMNLYTLPLGAKEIVRAKASVSIIVTGLITTALMLLLIILLRLQPGNSLIYYILIFPVLFEQSLFGLLIGTQFPDFSEGPRSRYVGITGSLVGMLVGTILAVITLLPVIVYLVFAGGVFHLEPGFFVALGITFLIAGLSSFGCYRLAVGNTNKLLQELPP